LDTFLLASVVDAGKEVATAMPVSTVEAFASFDLAFKARTIPAEGTVSERTVRSAFASVSPLAPKVGLAALNVSNPFMPPHSLAWYFGYASLPDEVRVYATGLRRPFLRVWCADKTANGVTIIVQVLGADSASDAIKMVSLEQEMSAKRLRFYTVEKVSSYTDTSKELKRFMTEYAPAVLEQQGLGHFVKIDLLRRIP
jgi:hypothetical protein